MSPLIRDVWDGTAWLPSGGLEAVPFISGLDSFGIARRGTVPTQANTGYDANVTYEPYVGANAGGERVITAAGTTFTNMDMGTTRFDIRAPDVEFINCTWDITTYGSSTWMVDWRNSGNTGGGRMYNCRVTNHNQTPADTVGIGGWNVTLERCQVEGFVDNMGFYIPGSPGVNTPLGVTVVDCYLGPMSFYAHPTGGVVHGSDTKTHNDGIQHQGGTGLRVINSVVLGYYSTTVGTGTPGSGSEFIGGTGYNQANGVAQRYAIVEGGGTYSEGQPGEFLGGSIAGIMITPVSNGTKGTEVDLEIAYVYGGGGSNFINAGSDVISGSSLGTVKGLRVIDDQRSSGFALSVDTGVAVTTSDNFWTPGAPGWASTGVAITRRNG